MQNGRYEICCKQTYIMSLASSDKGGKEKISKKKEIVLAMAPMEGILKETIPQVGAILCAMC